MPRQDIYRLTPFDFKFSQFTPTEYEARIADPNIPQRSLQLQEARQTESRQQQDIIDQTLRDTRMQLNPEEFNAFDKRLNTIRDRIDTALKYEDWGTAIKIARDEAHNLKTDTNLQNKIRANAIYQKEKEKVQNSGLDKYTKLYWDIVNNYYDDGTGDWKPQITLANDINIANLQNLAVSMTAEDAQSISSSTKNNDYVLVDKDNNVTTDLTQAVSARYNTITSGGGGISTHNKTKEDIEKTFRNLLADTSIGASMKQKLDSSLTVLDYFDNRSKDLTLSETIRRDAKREADIIRSELTDKNGHLIRDYDEWIDEKIIPMFKNNEYYNTAKSSESSNITDISSDLFETNKKRLTNPKNNGEESTTIGKALNSIHSIINQSFGIQGEEAKSFSKHF